MRELKRPITRRIGKYVVTLCAEGVSIREYRHAKHSAAQVTIQELLSLAGADRPPRRQDAFRTPAPRGWIPRGGDRVYLDPAKTGLASGVIISVIQAVPELLFLVRVCRGKTRMFALTELRPAPARKVREQPQNGRLLALGD